MEPDRSPLEQTKRGWLDAFHPARPAGPTTGIDPRQLSQLFQEAAQGAHIFGGRSRSTTDCGGHSGAFSLSLAFLRVVRAATSALPPLVSQLNQALTEEECWRAALQFGRCAKPSTRRMAFLKAWPAASRRSRKPSSEEMGQAQRILLYRCEPARLEG